MFPARFGPGNFDYGNYSYREHCCYLICTVKGNIFFDWDVSDQVADQRYYGAGLLFVTSNTIYITTARCKLSPDIPYYQLGDIQCFMS
jgi:hypothetical protein